LDEETLAALGAMAEWNGEKLATRLRKAVVFAVQLKQAGGTVARCQHPGRKRAGSRCGECGLDLGSVQ